MSVYTEQCSWLSVYINISYNTDLCENYCTSMKMEEKRITSENFSPTNWKDLQRATVELNEQWLETLQ